MSATYVVQTYSSGKRGRLMADSPMQAQSTSHAMKMAERLAERKALVIAFQQVGDPQTGEYEEAKLIAAFGQVPDEVLEMERVQ